MGAVMGSKNLKAVAVRPWQTLSHQGDVCYGRKSGINLRKLECRSRGSIRCAAKVTDHIDPRVVHLYHGYKESNCNVLTDHKTFDLITGSTGLKSLVPPQSLLGWSSTLRSIMNKLETPLIHNLKARCYPSLQAAGQACFSSSELVPVRR